MRIKQLWSVFLWFFTAAHVQAALQAPQISASSYILMDAQTGHILAEQNSDQPLPPASLTKMMSDYVISEALHTGAIHLDDPVQISKKAWSMQGSKMFVLVDTQIPLQDLLRGMIIQSGNDATVALAEHVAGSEEIFAQRMNETARSLGMTQSVFRNATGWPDPEHVSTARDLAILAQAMINHHPEQYKLYAEKEFVWENIRQPNRNLLLWRDSSVDGIKTGHTEAAGYCLVASAVQNGMRLISVVMGTQSEDARATESQKLLNYGFRNFTTKEFFPPNSTLETVQLWYGQKDTVPVGVSSAVALTLERGSEKNLAVTVSIENIIKAPIKKGQTLGVLNITLNDKTLLSEPVIAMEDIEQAGLFKRLIDAIKLFFAQIMEKF